MAKLSIGHYVKNLKLIERNREWLGSEGVSGRDKMVYYAHIALSYAAQKKKIKYLGDTLYYDNPATPLNLQNYPHEITAKVLANMHRRPKTVLDIGGNLGQFAITIDHVLHHKAKIDSFEPNTFIYEYLKRNVENKESINIYNYGLGDKDGSVTLHFDPDRTGIGSVMKQNAGQGAVMKQDISITSHPSRITKRQKYDLVKIDVEGYEMHALQGLADIKCEYLFIEISGQGRKKDYMHSELLALLEKQWGEFDIYYTGAFGRKSDTFDMLIRFKANK